MSRSPPGALALAPVPAIDIVVEAGDWPNESALRKLMEPAMAATIAAWPKAVAGSEVALVFASDERIAELNGAHRGKPRPTNVLSFPAAPPRGGRFGPLLGDIVFAAETISAEARDLGLTLEQHLTHLLVHGMLHLLGLDHLEDEEADRMERLEIAILATLGIADPYAGADLEDGQPAGDKGP